jgi:ATP-binding cassette subfamily C (CFTR/MRP) protein 2
MDVSFILFYPQLMSNGEILQEGPYHRLLALCKEFQDLVNAHKETAGSERLTAVNSAHTHGTSSREIRKTYVEKQLKACKSDQLIKKEEREIGDTGFKPYRQYLNQNKGFLYFSMASITHLIFVIGLILWLLKLIIPMLAHRDWSWSIY